MMPMTARSIGAFLLGTTAVMVGLWWLFGSQYSLRSSRASPDGHFSVFEFQSHQSGREHAPHGTVLSLTADSSLGHPEDGHVIFAGYCRPALAYRWVDNQRIAVDCPNRGDVDVRTLSTRAFGITITLNGR
jgi:hypothetical protein